MTTVLTYLLKRNEDRPEGLLASLRRHGAQAKKQAAAFETKIEERRTKNEAIRGGFTSNP